MVYSLISLNNMDYLEKRSYYIDLFEVYEKLLTPHQINYFKAYYYDDLTLQEISDNFSVSRNAIFDQLKKTVEILLNYENKLHLDKIKKELYAFSEKLDEKMQNQLLEIIEDVK